MSRLGRHLLLAAPALALLMAVACGQGQPGPTPPGPDDTPVASAPIAPAGSATPVPSPPPAATLAGPVTLDVATPTSQPSSTASPRPSPTPAPRPSPTPAPRPSPTPAVTVVPQPLTEMAVEVAFPNLRFIQPVALAYPDDGTNRLFVVLQHGLVRVFDNDPEVTAIETFLDIRQRVSTRGNEEGLLGLAFHPRYESNGYFYAYYSAASPRRSVVSRFSVSQSDPDIADPDGELVILEVPQPFSNHNGGQILFGPDGYLYIGLGDGGSRADPRGNGQNTSTLLGAILRIDVDSPSPGASYGIPPDNPFADGQGGARGEIWAYGLRNPWRFSFDRTTGDLWAGDVGQDRFEEIDLVEPGRNYGWNVMEGTHCFARSDCDRDGLTPPVVEYALRPECSVTGGYVYRGSRLPSLHGAYIYADFCSGRVWALRHDGAQVTEQAQIAEGLTSVSSFGEDRAGEVYVLSFDGNIYRFQGR